MNLEIERLLVRGNILLAMWLMFLRDGGSEILEE